MGRINISCFSFLLKTYVLVQTKCQQDFYIFGADRMEIVCTLAVLNHTGVRNRFIHLVGALCFFAAPNVCPLNDWDEDNCSSLPPSLPEYTRICLFYEHRMQQLGFLTSERSWSFILFCSDWRLATVRPYIQMRLPSRPKEFSGRRTTVCPPFQRHEPIDLQEASSVCIIKHKRHFQNLKFILNQEVKRCSLETYRLGSQLVELVKMWLYSGSKNQFTPRFICWSSGSESTSCHQCAGLYNTSPFFTVHSR